jgi:Trk K+ transport system NAD-binding subunit
VILTERDDMGNLHAGLVAQDLNPHAMIVLHMFDIELGQQVRTLLHKCEVLSSSAIAAPAFIAAALHLDWEQRIDVAGHSVIVRSGTGQGGLGNKARRPVSIGATAGDQHTLLPLACIKGNGTASLFPDTDTLQGRGASTGDGARSASSEIEIGEVCENTIFLVDGGPIPQAPARYKAARNWFSMAGLGRQIGALVTAADSRLRGLMLLFLVLLVVSTVIFWLFQDLSPVDALYFTVSTVTTTGFGDISLINAHPALKIYGILLMLLGAASLAIVYALITDVLVGARLAGATVTGADGLQNHVVVCGLGNIGYRVVEKLANMDVPVAACDLNGSGHYVDTIRQMEVPAVVADARVPQTLKSLGIERARCLVAAVDKDQANLQIALTARRLNPQLRVVVRIFDPDLAARVEHSLEIAVSRSPAALTAPALVAAAVGGRVLATIQVADQVVFIAGTTIEAGSEADGNNIARLEEPRDSDAMDGIECRVFLLSFDGQQQWSPSKETVLRAGYEVVLAVSQRKLAHVLSLTNPGPVGQV